MTWVHEYGDTGAELISQPGEVWEHPLTEYLPRDARRTSSFRSGLAKRRQAT